MKDLCGPKCHGATAPGAGSYRVFNRRAGSGPARPCNRRAGTGGRNGLAKRLEPREKNPGCCYIIVI